MKLNMPKKSENLHYVVSMRSKDYGQEFFDYDSLDEALAGYRRLKKNAAKLKDGVERAFEITIRLAEGG